MLEGLKPLAHKIAEAGLILDTSPPVPWGQAEARALGSVFSGHKLKHLHLRGTRGTGGFPMNLGFLPALALALPHLESLSLSHTFLFSGESLRNSSPCWFTALPLPAQSCGLNRPAPSAARIHALC
jgi:hypothetical protein